MTTLVLTVIGDDRSGLVEKLSQVVEEQGGNWEESRLAELAGKFAGIVVVSVPDDREDALTQALKPLARMLDIAVHHAEEAAPAASGDSAAEPEGERTITVELLGNDHPGMLHELSAALAAHQVTIVDVWSDTRQAPMAGGQLFEAKVTGSTSAQTDLTAMREDLERLAGELQIDLSVSGT